LGLSKKDQLPLFSEDEAEDTLAKKENVVEEEEEPPLYGNATGDS